MNRQQVAEVIMTFNCIQISSSKITTSLALAVRLNRPEILAILLITEFDFSVGSEGRAKSRSSSGIDAVKHINTQCYSQGKIDRVSHSHQVSGFGFRESLATLANGAEEIFLGLSARKPTNSKSRCILLYYLPEYDGSEARIYSSLDNREQGLALGV